MRDPLVRKTLFSHVKVPSVKSSDKSSKPKRAPSPSGSEFQESGGNKEDEQVEESDDQESTEEELTKESKPGKKVSKD